MDRAWTVQRERFSHFIQTISSYDTLQEQENLKLHAQIHDLTELLAAFDLCELQDPHLIAVRDRAFQRDITSEVELLRVYRLERQLQQEDIKQALNDGPIERNAAADHRHGEFSKVRECHENTSSTGLDVESLQQRIELLEQEVIILRLRQELSEETTSKLQWRAVADVDADHVDYNHDVENDQEQERDRVVCDEHCEKTATVIQEQQERIAELENLLATEVNKNAALQRQTLRYRQVENILLEFSRCRSSTL